MFRARCSVSVEVGRAENGKRVLATVLQELYTEFGAGYSYSALTRMVKFAEIQSDKAIVVTLSQQLSWSHFLGDSDGAAANGVATVTAAFGD
jgi:hypothetical protein